MMWLYAIKGMYRYGGSYPNHKLETAL